jgi:hypothetical protein
MNGLDEHDDITPGEGCFVLVVYILFLIWCAS